MKEVIHLPHAFPPKPRRIVAASSDWTFGVCFFVGAIIGLLAAPRNFTLETPKTASSLSSEELTLLKQALSLTKQALATTRQEIQAKVVQEERMPAKLISEQVVPKTRVSNATTRSIKAADGYRAKTIKSRSRLRSAPSKSGEIVAVLTKGTSLYVVDELNGWLKVYSPFGEVAWIHSQLVVSK